MIQSNKTAQGMEKGNVIFSFMEGSANLTGEIISQRLTGKRDFKMDRLTESGIA